MYARRKSNTTAVPPISALQRKLSSTETGRFQVDSVRKVSRNNSNNAGAVNAGYVTDDGGHKQELTFDQYTREALPKLDNYKDLMSLQFANRPTLDELHYNGTFRERPSSKDEENGIDDTDAPVKGVFKLGWMKGVLMTCLLNIWGVMLFLRLSWVVGQAGIVEGFFVITLANAVTFITGLSMSAVSTNGQIKGGGIYYMISRSLGPEFGAPIGLMFTLANSIAVSMYIVGFCESLNDLFQDNNIPSLIDGGENDIRAIGSIVLVLILILAIVGMSWVTRAQVILLVILIAAQVVFVIGSFVGPTSDEQRAKGFIGYNFDTFKDNLMSDYRQGIGGDDSEQSFFSVFGVFFPAVTGIVAGANLSGDLKDPSSAIPKGTMLAIVITYVTYFGYAIMVGGGMLREASGDVDQYLASKNYTDQGIEPPPGFVSYTNCTWSGENTCKYGSLNSQQVMELVSIFGYLIYAGCFAATLSSAIASLAGAPRVLQALAKDKLYPKIDFFATGYGPNNDPIRGYVVVSIIALGCLLIAKLNAIAPLLSNFFLAAYCLINFAVFHATISKSPGWRPSFKYYNAWASLAGSILCIVVMFMVHWITALITVGVLAFLYLYVSYVSKPDVNWGSSTQAQSYNFALKYVQDLNFINEHVKNFRPQILVLSGLPSSRPPLVDFANLLTKNLSLMICGHVVKGAYNQRIRTALQKQGYNWLAKHQKKGFFVVTDNDSFENGCKSLMEISGLGKLKPNMILLGYKNNWPQLAERRNIKEYFDVIHEAFDMHLAVGILRVPEQGLDYSTILEEEDQLKEQQVLDIMCKEKPLTRNMSIESHLSIDSTGSDNIRPPLTFSQVEAGGVVGVGPVCDLNGQGAHKQQSEAKKNKARKKSVSDLYAGRDGAELSRPIRANITRFRRKQKRGTIDVWWLYDDGGLTMLLPYILTTRSKFAGCHLRIFTLASKKDDLTREQRNMAALLAKFRINYGDVVVIPGVTNPAKESTRAAFNSLVEPFKVDEGSVGDGSEDGDASLTTITESELLANRDRTNRHLRLHEELQHHSKNSTLVVMTLPMPRKGAVSAPLYLAWMEMLTKDMPSFLLVRGNQQSVLTFYS